ncbi:MAG: aminotransferase class V-fold PLP-dependent enzyme [Deltaproteobacteria bacterium]|nr:aminotransferase class V-fold PLP-dependent enzyme [Deltaproteobacteria bacterium]
MWSRCGIFLPNKDLLLKEVGELKRVESNLEYLRKLFIMPDTPDKFMEFGHAVLEMIHDFFQEKEGLHKRITLPELAGIFNQTSMPESPHLIRDVLAEIKDKVTVHSVKVGSPYYIGHMTSAVPYFMILLEIIIASLNQNQVKIETAKASSFVERELIAWVHRMIFNRSERFYQRNIQNPRVAIGNVTSGGTMSNLNALLVAREKALPADRRFPGVKKAGMERALRYHGFTRLVVLTSKRGHYSIQKSANLLGLGEENVIEVPVDTYNRIDISRLKRMMRAIKRDDRAKGTRTKIMAIVGIAGNTETGNIDNLKELGDIARQEGAFFHVDAAWGGSALIVDEYRHLFQGIEAADSVSVDFHKLLYCPMAMSVVVFHNERDLNHLKQISQYVNRRESVDTGRFTIEGSRSFACLKPWASLKIMGKDGYRLLFEQAREAMLTFKRILEDSRKFEILNDPELFILNYRFVPQFVMEKLHELMEMKKSPSNRAGRDEATRKARRINRVLNTLNVQLQKSIRLDDTTFVSRTTIESTRYRPQRIVVLRAVLINPLINDGILKKIVSTQNRIGLSLAYQYEPLLREAVA